MTPSVMKKLIAGVASMALVVAAVATSLMGGMAGANGTAAQFHGKATLHTLPSTTVFAMSWEKSHELLAEMHGMVSSLELMLGEEMVELNDVLSALEEIESLAVLVAVNDVNALNFSDLASTDENAVCIVAALRMNEPARSEFLAGKPDNILQEELYGNTYLSTEGCFANRDLRHQEGRVSQLRTVMSTPYALNFFVNKESLQKAFMKSEMFAESFGALTAENIAGFMLYGDEENYSESVAQIENLLNTARRMNIVQMFLDANQMYAGFGMENGMLMEEIDVEFGTPENSARMAEMYDAQIRVGKMFLTPEVQVEISTMTENTTSMNKVVYSNLDASIFFAGLGNMMSQFVVMGAMDAAFAPSYHYDDDYYYEDDYYDFDMDYDYDTADDYDFDFDTFELCMMGFQNDEDEEMCAGMMEEMMNGYFEEYVKNNDMEMMMDDMMENMEDTTDEEVFQMEESTEDTMENTGSFFEVVE